MQNSYQWNQISLLVSVLLSWFQNMYLLSTSRKEKLLMRETWSCWSIAIHKLLILCALSRDFRDESHNPKKIHTCKTLSIIVPYKVVLNYDDGTLSIWVNCVCCSFCKDYDLCSICEQVSEQHHNATHVFIRIPHPLKPNVFRNKILIPSKFLKKLLSSLSSHQFSSVSLPIYIVQQLIHTFVWCILRNWPVIFNK